LLFTIEEKQFTIWEKCLDFLSKPIAELF